MVERTGTPEHLILSSLILLPQVKAWLVFIFRGYAKKGEIDNLGLSCNSKCHLLSWFKIENNNESNLFFVHC